MSNENDLTDKQKAFIEEYFLDFNATRAAERAGYRGNENTLASIGSENLRKPKIRKHISERLSESCMSADEVLARLADQARGNIADFIRAGGAIDWEEVAQNGHLVKSIAHTTGKESRIELHGSQRALELIGKAHGLFRERHIHSGPKDGPIEVDVTVTDTSAREQIRSRLARIRARERERADPNEPNGGEV